MSLPSKGIVFNHRALKYKTAGADTRQIYAENLMRCPWLTDVMTDAGFEVIGAPDAKSALELADAVLLPQIIIRDVNLGPGMDSFTLVTAARRRIPVLMMSDMVTNFAGRHRGADERFLLKPFSLDTFLRNVTDLVGKG